MYLIAVLVIEEFISKLNLQISNNKILTKLSLLIFKMLLTMVSTAVKRVLRMSV